MTTRCKFKLSSITHQGSTAKIYKFHAICDSSVPENVAFTKYTPRGELSVLIDNPAVDSMFTIGESCYLDLTPLMPTP